MKASTLSLSFCILLCGSLVLCNESAVDIYPDQQLDIQTTLPDEAIIYYLHNLAPNSHYELRISYPASTPADFSFQIMEQEIHHSVNNRELLNAEKISFTTDEKGYITHREPPSKGFHRVKITIKPTGVKPLGSKQTKDPVRFNIVLDTLVLGAPADVLKMGMFVAVMCVLVATIIVPQVFPRMPGFKSLVD